MRRSNVLTAVIITATVLTASVPAKAYLHPRLGRFLQRDPAGYVDGMGLYEYERSGPLGQVDPTGREKTDAERAAEWRAKHGMGGGTGRNPSINILKTFTKGKRGYGVSADGEGRYHRNDDGSHYFVKGYGDDSTTKTKLTQRIYDDIVASFTARTKMRVPALHKKEPAGSGEAGKDTVRWDPVFSTTPLRAIRRQLNVEASGFSGYLFGYNLNAKCVKNKCDFSGTKYHFMAFAIAVAKSPVEGGELGRIYFGDGRGKGGVMHTWERFTPTDTQEHELIHTDGLTPDILEKIDAKGTGFTWAKPKTEADVNARKMHNVGAGQTPFIGFRRAAERRKAKSQLALKVAEGKITAPVTHVKCLTILKQTLGEYLIGEKALLGIHDAGLFHGTGPVDVRIKGRQETREKTYYIPGLERWSGK